MAAFKYGCGEKNKEEPLGCKQGILKTKCYCTGTKCVPPTPTDKKAVKEAADQNKPKTNPTTNPKTNPKKNSANTIGTQVTIGFALFLAFFSKIMA